MRKTFKDYFVVLFGTAFSRGLSFLSSVLVARFLGPENFGKFSIFFLVSVITWYLPMAFDTSYVRFAKTSNSTAEKNAFLRSSIFLKLIYGALVILLSYPLAIFLARYAFQKPEIKWLLVLALVSGVFQSFLMSIASIFQEKEKFTFFSFLYSFYSGLILVILLLLVAFHWRLTLFSVVLAYFFSSFCVGLFSLFALFIKKFKGFLTVQKEFLVKSFELSKWAFGTNVLTSVFPRLDAMFLARFVEFGLLGIYSAGQQIIMIISVMTGSVSNTFLPKACKAVESNGAFRKFRKESLFLAGLINAALLVLIITSPWFIRLLYGPSYQLAIRITQILLLGWFFHIFYIPFAGLFFALDEADKRFYLEVFKYLVAIPLLLILVPRFKIIGAAVALSATLIINTIVALAVLWVSLRRKIKIYNSN